MRILVYAAVSCAASLTIAFAAKAEAPSVERGRYVVVTSGCNDCHTAEYGLKEGNVPESEWLKGDVVGWRGPWGTTYAPNLRLALSRMGEDEWVTFAKTFKARPPMPWFNVHAMEETDLRSMYLYVRSFQELGEPAPEYLPPDQEPPQPYIAFPPPPPSP
jgi:mono/diheme cytochrome c family protein